MTASRPRPRSRGEHAQATAELAVLLPVVVLLVMIAVQAGLLARDRVVAVHAARVAARAVAVEPTEAAATEALRGHGAADDRARVELRGDRSPGSVVTVVVTVRPVRVPLVGRVVARHDITEQLGAFVEGGA